MKYPFKDDPASIDRLTPDGFRIGTGPSFRNVWDVSLRSSESGLVGS